MRGRTPEEASFEQLAQSISRDFHPRSILDELVRLGLADVQAETVRLRATSFVPREDFEVQRKLLERAQGKLAALEARVAELEARAGR